MNIMSQTKFNNYKSSKFYRLKVYIAKSVEITYLFEEDKVLKNIFEITRVQFLTYFLSAQIENDKGGAFIFFALFNR